MEILFSFQNNLLEDLEEIPKRYLYDSQPFKHRLVALKGIRGVGKTTLLLQYLKENDLNTSLYVTADHTWFYTETLYSTAEKWYNRGGRLLIIDEVHKYQNWSDEIKNIYDGFPKLKLIVTSSSALEIYKGSADLSRRIISYDLHGLSFREYLNQVLHLNLKSVTIHDICDHQQDVAREFIKQVKLPLNHFTKYLQGGYLPICFQQEKFEHYRDIVIRIIEAVISNDMAFIFDYSPSYQNKVKRLLGIIAGLVPYSPNIQELSIILQVSRNTVLDWLQHLEKAELIKNIFRQGKGLGTMQKPDKILFENPNFNFALSTKQEIGTIRETIFVNQIKNCSLKINEALAGDYIVNDQYTFEIGGLSKKQKQIKEVKEGYVVKDDLEMGYNNIIPLWLFGMMY